MTQETEKLIRDVTIQDRVARLRKRPEGVVLKKREKGGRRPHSPEDREHRLRLVTIKDLNQQGSNYFEIAQHIDAVQGREFTEQNVADYLLLIAALDREQPPIQNSTQETIVFEK